MQIIANAIPQYDPRILIHEGKRVLKTVRLLADESHSKDVLYVSTSLFDNRDTEQVVCSNGYDIMLLNSNDPTGVFNSIMDVFDEYTMWSDRIWNAARSDDINALLKIGEEKLNGFLAVSDLSFYNMAATSNAEKEMRRAYGSIQDEEAILPTEMIRVIAAYPQLWKQNDRAYSFKPEGLSIAGGVRNLFNNAEHVGWLVYGKSETEVTEAELDIIDEIGDAIGYWISHQSTLQTPQGYTGVFRDLISNNYSDRKSISIRLRTVGAKLNGQFKVYCLIPFEANCVSRDALIRRVSSEFENIPCGKSEDMVFLIETQGTHSIDKKKFNECLKGAGWAAGESPLFKSIFLLHDNWILAQRAAAYSSSSRLITDWGSIALKAIIDSIDFPHEAGVHPAVTALHEYDIKHGTDMARTLQVYLQNDKNLVLTANALGVHRNTVVYRIEKILSMTNMDLEDPYERLYIALSFLL